jgi:hypothetical protein
VSSVGRYLYDGEEAQLPAKLDEALAELYDLAFRLPQALGMGDHWPLAPHEAKALGVATANCLRTGRGRSKLAKRIAKSLPWLSLVATAYIVVYPRVIQTRWVHGANATGVAGDGATVRSTGAPPAGAAAAGPTWADPAAVARLRTATFGGNYPGVS